MVKKVAEILGLRFVSRKAYRDFSLKKAEGIVVNEKLKKQLNEALVTIAQLKAQVRKNDIIDVKIGDPSPIDKVKRSGYVSQVAGLHKQILEPKLKQMISNMHLLLEEATNDRETDQTLKGAIFLAWELIRWGDSMVNEQVANQTSQIDDKI